MWTGCQLLQGGLVDLLRIVSISSDTVILSMLGVRASNSPSNIDSVCQQQRHRQHAGQWRRQANENE